MRFAKLANTVSGMKHVSVRKGNFHHLLPWGVQEEKDVHTTPFFHQTLITYCPVSSQNTAHENHRPSEERQENDLHFECDVSV